MQRPLVVGVDGSAGSLRALDWAVAEAARHGAALRLVHAAFHDRHGSADPGHAGLDAAQYIVDAAVERARRACRPVQVEGVVIAADPVDALLDEDRRTRALVTGSRGHGTLAGLLLGSVSLTVSARAHCPVIVVRGTERSVHGTFHRITLGVGDASADAAVMRFAVEEAEARGCELHAVRAWRAPAHHAQYHPLLTGGPHVAHEELASEALTAAVGVSLPERSPATLHREVAEGPVGKVLLGASAASDLLVVGATRTGDRTGLQLGRAGHTVLHHASCPVAVVPRSV
ncbi:universal stress protein [Streptomyces meridianus]|uniref:Universal stress protein n=1 Tax=Streptomyces meridianus TaxID=2938945 RepID=A0ABT0X6S3_9ACTN|nr:universal stress protein [Streptomyces meridianus]MCM2577412.1 universal stress protein [Streptomyces meridianus]